MYYYLVLEHMAGGELLDVVVKRVKCFPSLLSTYFFAFFLCVFDGGVCVCVCVCIVSSGVKRGVVM